MAELPRIVSVDDHVIEPAHLFETWLPAKYRERGPQPLTAGIGELAYVAGKYQITMDPDGPPTDWWIYEELKFPYKRNIAAVGFDRDEMTLEGITRAEMRPGCWDPKERLKDMDLNHVEASALLPHLPAVLRADLRRGARQGGRARLRTRLQRLDGRGVVRRQRRPADPAVHHPAVGHRPRGRRDQAERGARRARGDLLRDPDPPRPAVDPLRLLGPVLRRLPGDRDGREHAHRVVLADARRIARRTARRPGVAVTSTTPWPR